MDIEAKESRPDRDGVRIAALDEMTFQEKRRNVILFMESTQYVELNPNKSISSKELYAIYTI